MKCLCCNMLTDVKLSKTQLSKMIQTGGFLCRMLRSLGRRGKELAIKVITDFVIFSARNNATLNAT